jgi:tetratricopeptide (TPR) repeat protein
VTSGFALAQHAKKTPPSSGSTQAANLLQTGRNLFEDQRYEESIQTLSAALLRPNTPKKDRVEVYRLLAYNYVVLSHRDEAEAAVRGLYALDPEFALGSSESPRFKEFFAEVKTRWEADGKPGLVTEVAAPPKQVAIKHSSPAQKEQGLEIRLTGELDDPGSRTGSVVLHYRTGSQGKFEKVDARMTEGKFRTTIPGAAVKPPLVEYYFEALDGKGLPIAARGDALAPLRIAVPAPVPPPESGGLLSSPWFWTGTGAVLVGGVVTALVLTRSKSESPGTPTSRVIVTVGQQ